CLFLSLQDLTAQLDLKSCLAMADTANLTIRNAELDIEINKRERSSYLSSRLPQLGFNADYKYNAKIPGQVVPAAFFGGQPGTYATVQFGVPYVLSNNVQLTQILFNSQLNYGLAALKINADIVEVQRNMTIQDIRYQVSNTYFLLQGLEKQLSFLESNLSQTNKVLKNMNSLVGKGLALQLEADKIKVNLLNLENGIASAQASKEQLLDLLKILIGYPKDKTLTLAEDVIIEQSLIKAEDNKQFYPLKLIESQQEMNKEEGKGIKMSYLPNLNLYGVYNYSYNIKPEDDFRKGIDGVFIGLRLDWSLFDGLQRMHKSKMNAIRSNKLTNQYELANQQLEMAANQAKRQIKLKSDALSLSKEQLKLAENVYQQTNFKFEKGLANSTELILAENSLYQAQNNIVSTYVQLRQAELEYLKSIGNIK
ncbi:MAG: TolC family protein, partial [Crocinitomicaceae bacterium]